MHSHPYGHVADRVLPSDTIVKYSATFFTVLILTFSVMFMLAIPRPAIAGGTSENLLLIVNADSDSSKLIANHYIRWRQIPEKNIVYLTKIPKTQQMTVDQFRGLILKPIIAEIQKRKISAQIDYIVYSSGFPTKVGCKTDAEKLKTGNNKNLNKLLTPTVSLNAATFYFQSVMAGQPGYIAMDGNWYYRNKTSGIFQNPFVGPDAKIYQSGFRAYRDAQYEDALKTWQELAEKYTDNYVLLYQIARCYGQQEKAVEAGLALSVAAANGWQFGSYTKEDVAFAKVLENSAFQKVLKSLGNEDFQYLPTTGFRSRYAWQPNGVRATGTNTGRQYFLSTLLAVTTGRGNTDAEALGALKSAADADFTQPQGKFYFTKTKNVRSTTRTPNYADAIRFLSALGYSSEVVTTQVPNGKNDIIGATTGVAKFDWKKSQSRIMPGAICENLTSHGGRMETKAGQTPLTEFIKYGAAGSSGTIVEPYAVQAKFPHPMIHVHYARGATLAEAFYQSVHGPFQLLIVGDPLCQPFAKPPRFDLDGIKENQSVSGKIEMTFEPKVEGSIAHFEIFTDGIYRASLPVGKKLAIDTTKLTEGYHELRIVGVANNRQETRSRKFVPFIVENKTNDFLFKSDATTKTLDSKFQFTVKLVGAKKIEILHNNRVVGSVDRASGRINVECKTIGGGPVTVFAEATVDGKLIRSPAMELEIR